MKWKVGQCVGITSRGDFVPAAIPADTIGVIAEVNSTHAVVDVCAEYHKRCGGDTIQIAPNAPEVTPNNSPTRQPLSQPTMPAATRINVSKLRPGDVLDEPRATVLSVVQIFCKDTQMLEGYALVMRLHADDNYKRATIPSGHTIKLHVES